MPPGCLQGTTIRECLHQARFQCQELHSLGYGKRHCSPISNETELFGHAALKRWDFSLFFAHLRSLDIGVQKEEEEEPEQTEKKRTWNRSFV